MMYKCKLQELCQRRTWDLPKYSTVKDGPDHLPHFTAAVDVNGQVFSSPALCRSSKEAQASAAQIAFDYFNASPPPSAASSVPVVTNSNSDGEAAVSVAPPIAVAQPLLPELLAVDLIAPPAPAIVVAPPPELLAVDSIASPVSVAPAAVVAQPPEFPVVDPIAPPAPFVSDDPQPELPAVVPCARLAPVVAVDSLPKLPAVNPVASLGIPHLYKNQLLQYTDRENLGFPVYTTKGKGPPHERRFKSTVSVGGKSYEMSHFFPTLKEAEQAAAKVACQALSVDINQEDGGLYKNLLQEFAHKRGLMIPSYKTTSSGLSHSCVFVSTVEIGEYTFRGTEAKTKKQAEIDAAKVAYCTLAKGCVATKSSLLLYIENYPVAANVIQNIQPTTTTKKHQDTRCEDDYLPAKRAKPSTESTNMDTPSPSNFPVLAGPVVEPTPMEEPSLQRTFKTKTVVFRRKSNFPIPEGATVMTYSDDQWVAYIIDGDKAPKV